MEVNFREIWYNYRSEVFFFLILSAIVALSTWLSQWIPDEVFDNTITPILITATVTVATVGTWVLHRRNAGIKARKLFGCTFYQFVNKYRIEEAKRLMTEQPDLKMADVATQSGFSSRTAFYNTFSREVGMSPSEWSKECHPA